MASKFNCKNCGKEIIVKFMKLGETAKCRNCEAKNTVPSNAKEVSPEQADAYLKHSNTDLCEYCGARYVQGSATCPKCGANLTAKTNILRQENSRNLESPSTNSSKILKIETRDCIGVLRFMAWAYLLASIAGAIAVWDLVGSNPLGIGQGFALAVQGFIICPFLLCIVGIAEDVQVLSSR